MAYKIDKSELKRVSQQLRKLPGYEYGIHEDHPVWTDDEGTPRDADVVEVAYAHEYGIGQEYRPFISRTADYLTAHYADHVEDYIRAINTKGKAARFHELALGQRMRSEGMDYIESRRIKLAPNDAVYAASKGGLPPMIDTGNMVRMLDARPIKRGR